MKRKLLLIVVLCLLLTGCSSEKKDKYTLSEIYNSGDFGFFVKDGDYFYPVKSFDSSNTEGFMWTIKKINFPEVSEKTPLVAVYDAEMPEKYKIDKYKSLGYTIGANFFVGEDEDSIWVSTSNVCKDSNIDKMFQTQVFDENLEVESINQIKPYSNIDGDVNILTGLQENKYYDLTIFAGTKHITGSVCADTFVIKKVETTELENPFIKTADQYFVVNLPENLSPGYYNINDKGFFVVK